MNNFLRTAGVIALLLVVYSLLQAMAVYLVYYIINGSLSPGIFSNVDALIENPVISVQLLSRVQLFATP